MMNRRDFVKSAAAAGVALLGPRRLEAAAPALAIARYKSSPTAPDGIAEEARRLTRAGIDALGGMGRFVSKGQTVWIKPNISWDRRPEQAATTNPDVVATLVAMCYQAGAKRVLLSDNPCNSAQRTFPRSGIQQAAEKAGAQVFFMDERKFRKMALNGKVLKEWPVYAEVVECDVLINVPIAKHHSLTTVTLGMKNLMGVVGGARERFHQNTELTLPDLAAFLKPKLIVLDAIRVLTGNGPVGGSLADVKRKETIVAGTDQVAVDAYGATLLGHKPQAIEHIVEAGRRGLGNINFEAL
ncbi:MAG: DUF362 domain-containing protein, partial [Acidobacteria bacterium]|nr:DUF362 domain-containing protein [Acidobacteriota bacterium]